MVSTFSLEVLNVGDHVAENRDRWRALVNDVTNFFTS
jgi:hypothetical protein